jgi:outer membrane receptor protein involved in Fe transport
MTLRLLFTLVLAGLLPVLSAGAEERRSDGRETGATDEASSSETATTEDAEPPQEGAVDAADPDATAAATDAKKPAITERVVVSASATGKTQLDAPAATSVIEGESMEAQPGDHLVDQLRRVPGINVVQFSARDVNIASRSATGGINNSTLALTDGRTLYQDFLGFVMWEFAPEVVRGPASSLSGANAVGGLVHVITKSPRDTPGGSATVEAGSYDMLRVNATQSWTAGDWAFRVSGGTYRADPFERPLLIENFYGELIDPDLGLIEDDVRDSGTEQPRFDVRADWTDGEAEWILQAGWGQTRGWIATGLGPFDIDPSTSSSYLQARWVHGTYQAMMDVNFFDGEALNLINAIPFSFTSAGTHAGFRGTDLIGGRGVVGWGIDLYHSDYDLSIAPLADKRRQAAAYGEVDYRLSGNWWLDGGARLDYFHDKIGTVVSPRIATRYKLTPNQTLRVAYGKAFRAPSVIETDLYVPVIPVAILDWEVIDAEEVGFPFFQVLAQGVCATQPDNCGVPPGETVDYIAVTAAVGESDLEEETTRSIEVGYAATLGRFNVSASVYHTKSENGIDFPQQETYGSGPDGLPGTDDDVILPSDPDGDGIDEAPPVDVCGTGLENFRPFDEICPNQPVPYNQALSILLDGLVPSRFQYANGARREDFGVELGGTWFGPSGLSLTLNYSWQDVPLSDGVKMTDRIDLVLEEVETGEDIDGDGLIGDTSSFVNIPAAHRVSFTAQIARPRWTAAVTYDRLSETFWQDVLTSDFWGWVPGYELVGARGSYAFPRQHVEVFGQVTNLTGDEIQQHIYGDLIARRFAVGMSFTWGGAK